MVSFADATAVQRVAEDRFATTLSEVWCGAPDVPLGGVTLATAARALGEALDGDPLTVTGHFLQPATFGETTIRTEVLRRGATQIVGRARLCQGDRPLLEVVGTYGRYPSDDADPVTEPPSGPGPRDACEDPRPPDLVPLMDEIAVLAAPGAGRWATGDAYDEPVVDVWLALTEDADRPDPYLAIVLADYGPPLPWVIGRWGLVPTVALTVQVRRPATGWLRTRYSMPWLDRQFVADCTLWDEDGRIVATGRQLGLLLPAT